jgi:hypothetical protein
MLILDDAFLAEPEAPIFFRREYIALHGGTYCQLVEKGKALTGIWLMAGRSPGRATFGGLSQTVEAKTAYEFLQELVTRRGLREVALPPSDHDPERAAIQINALSRLGFRMVPELNYSLAVDGQPLADHMASGNRKKLEKCRAAGFQARGLERNLWERAHALLTANREREGRSMSMSKDDVLCLADALPGIVRYHGVFTEDELVAAALTMDVAPRICYVYAWGDSRKSEYAPTVALADWIYSDCRSRHITRLDAGISTVDGVPNDGLVRFKRSLGFRGSLKATMKSGG